LHGLIKFRRNLPVVSEVGDVQSVQVQCKGVKLKETYWCRVILEKTSRKGAKTQRKLLNTASKLTACRQAGL
jgi:hypothetical protein